MTKFLMDAQLPRRLAHAMRELDCNVVHTLDLPNGNRTSDAEINLISLEAQRVVITKDADFVESFLLQGAPYKLLLVSTGNIDNRGPLSLFAANQSHIAALFDVYDYVELGRDQLIAHQ